MAFQDTWDALVNAVVTHKKVTKPKWAGIIPKWSKDSGYSTDCLKIDRIDNNSKIIHAKILWKNGEPIDISYNSLKDVYDGWDDYRNGKIKRTELKDGRRRTSYAISILKWLEGEISITPLP